MHILVGFRSEQMKIYSMVRRTNKECVQIIMKQMYIGGSECGRTGNNFRPKEEERGHAVTDREVKYETL